MERSSRRSMSSVSFALIFLLSSAYHDKTLADIQSLSNGSSTPSPISSINGRNVSEVSEVGRAMQDFDALYNSVFYSPASTTAQNARGHFASGPFIGQSDTNTLRFENGTTVAINANVFVKASLATQLPKSGQDFYKQIANTTSPQLPSSPPLTPLPLGPTYPSPIMKHSQNWISGYFMNGTENSDVAVLSVPSFNAESPLQPEAIEFIFEAATFLEECRSSGKKRLIVDVRNNGGGLVTLGYDLFQLLFPREIPYSGVRLRASNATNMIGKIASASNSSAVLTGSQFNAKGLLQRPLGLNYTSWEQFYGPFRQHDDLFSNVGAWQYSTPQNAAFLGAGIQNATNLTTLPSQVFSNGAITLVRHP